MKDLYSWSLISNPGGGGYDEEGGGDFANWTIYISANSQDWTDIFPDTYDNKMTSDKNISSVQSYSTINWFGKGPLYLRNTIICWDTMYEKKKIELAEDMSKFYIKHAKWLYLIFDLARNRENSH